MLSNLSMLMDERGNEDEAYALRKRSVEMSMKSFKSGQPSQITSLIDLSQRASQRQETDYALAMARKAADIADELYAEPEPLRIYAQLVLADALAASGDYVAAAQSLRRAEGEVAGLPPEMKNLRNLAAASREALCAASADAALAPPCGKASSAAGD